MSTCQQYSKGVFQGGQRKEDRISRVLFRIQEPTGLSNGLLVDKAPIHVSSLTVGAKVLRAQSTGEPGELLGRSSATN